MNKKLILTIGLVIGLVAGITAGVGALVNAYNGGSPKVVVEGNYIEAPKSEANLGNVSFDTGYFPEIAVDGVSTLNEIALGNKFSGSIDFSVSQQGKNTSIANNTGKTQICNLVQVQFTSASDAGGLTGTGSPFTLSAATSTSATLFSAGNAGGILASTTIATGTTPLLDNIVHKGTGVATAGQTWLWNDGVYLNFTVGSLYGGLAATSTAYTNLAAKFYIHCIEQ